MPRQVDIDLSLILFFSAKPCFKQNWVYQAEFRQDGIESYLARRFLYSVLNGFV